MSRDEQWDDWWVVCCDRRKAIMDSWYRRAEVLGLEYVCWPASFKEIERLERERGITPDFPVGVLASDR